MKSSNIFEAAMRGLLVFFFLILAPSAWAAQALDGAVQNSATSGTTITLALTNTGGSGVEVVFCQDEQGGWLLDCNIAPDKLNPVNQCRGYAAWLDRRCDRFSNSADVSRIADVDGGRLLEAD